MHLLISCFASIGYLHGVAGLRELSFEFEFVYSLWLWYFLIKLSIFDVSAVGSVKQNLSRKECDKAFRALSRGCYHHLPLPHHAVGLSAMCDCGSSWSYALTF